MPPVVIVIIKLLFVSRFISFLEKKKNVLPPPVPISQPVSVSPIPNP